MKTEASVLFERIMHRQLMLIIDCSNQETILNLEREKLVEDGVSQAQWI
jgi:hypothetical protein